MKNNVKAERVRCYLTQQELADAIEVSRQTIHSIEANRYVPSTILALKLAKTLQVKVEDLFELEETD
ncbi:helix-turn-helix transcriptional regulator [Myroides sp. 1354]|uniref:helix-turn-helix transcriptional regulator n=1 Tax=unclassified Myroides TaxID=2642485 RepID=UPI0025778558|nr:MULTISPECIES: helix-turn-helix transcriptional regulator [unclassified Myroides]MDM1045109.1 helix-turn-helix transcriptional regulator [Myroides sp. R163-1]MDM1055991.1 helix-turn-helix transcriptional regulator [Myroides sp. 1354]MDM1069060.1 helix-turn-helix transcriptional regulator [Myroides sp. 1372]